MRIASLVPSATESLFALGLGFNVVAVTHECDWPPPVRDLPQLTRSLIPTGLGSAEIDERVRELTARGGAIYALDEELLAGLGVDLIVTQALCAVCAVSYEEVCAVAAGLPRSARVLSLDPVSLGEVLDDLDALAGECEVPAAGRRLRAELEARLERVQGAVRGRPPPRTLALEWLDPPFVGGHWVPEMIELAGGRDVAGTASQRSRTASWEELRPARPDLVVVMPCGLYADEAAAEAAVHSERLAELGAGRVVAVDAASSFSRPGPRLVDGVELLAHILHPDAVAAPTGVEWRSCL